MSLHACSVTNSWFGRTATHSADFGGLCGWDQGFMWRETQWILSLVFLFTGLVVISMKLQFCGDAANTGFNLLLEPTATILLSGISSSSLHPVNKAVIDTVTYRTLWTKACIPLKSHLTLKLLITSGRDNNKVHWSDFCYITLLWVRMLNTRQ